MNILSAKKMLFGLISISYLFKKNSLRITCAEKFV